MKKIVIAGGTGYLGQVIVNHYKGQNVNFTILTRKHKENEGNVNYVKWDGRTLGSWVTSMEGAEALINLNGRSVDCRYNEHNKQSIYDSRIDATFILGKAINQCKNPPKLWINGASATIYRHSLDKPMNEKHGEFGEGFSVDVCKKWEATFEDFDLDQTRKVLLRIAIVLGKHDGAFIPMKNLTQIGFGGRMGSGEQMISWLHEEDFGRIVDYCIRNKQLEGVYNAAAPDPVRNSMFQKVLRKQLGKFLGIPLAKWMLEVGAMLIGTETELILKSRFVIPENLLNAGFHFKYSKLESALKELTH